MSVTVSILTAVYNGAGFLPEMLASVEKQTFKNYELVLVNDASKDTTLEVMQAAQNNFPGIPSIKIITYDKNKTLPGALNEGLKSCTGEYLFRLDADDMITPDCLEKLAHFIEQNPTYDGVLCDELKVDGNLKPKYMLLKLLDNYYIKKQNLFRVGFGGPTSFIKRERYIQAGWHDERLKTGSDRGIGLDMHKLITIGHVPECLYIYREHETNITKTLSPFKKTALFREIMQAHLANAITSDTDYVNDWDMIKKFITISSPHHEIRRMKYANIILKCAITLAKKQQRTSALLELTKADYVHPRPRYFWFKLFIFFGLYQLLDWLYVNMNVWTDYAYDDYYLYLPEQK